MNIFTREVHYITTPLYYVNAKPHLGHAYATLVADTLTRHYRQREKEVFFLTGTDEHGEKIAAMAQKEGKSPIEFANSISEEFQTTWSTLGIEPDIFYRTTQVSHYKLVQNALQYLKDKGEIYFATYTGKYCVGCERFRTDQEWNAEDLCPDHLTKPDLREESNYFFKMSSYKEQLLTLYKAHPQAIVPAQYMKEVLSFLEQPLEDLCISRPTKRLTWGIPLPFDDKYVTYVWFDALLSYLGGLGYQGPGTQYREDLWAQSYQILGKDILKTHAVYWPTMLMALGVPVFHKLNVSGFWLSDGIKMSKSLGNVVSPLVVKEKFGIEPLRYFLLRECAFGGDANFSWESFISRSNADLANGVGNLASRTLTLSHKNLDAKIPSKEFRNDKDKELLKAVHELAALFAKEFDASRFHLGLAAFSETVAKCDKYINDEKPWSLAKDPLAKERLAAVLGTAMDALWTLGVVMSSVLPEGAKSLALALGASSSEGAVPWSRATEMLPEGRALGPVPRLFPRLEMPKEE